MVLPRLHSEAVSVQEMFAGRKNQHEIKTVDSKVQIQIVVQEDIRRLQNQQTTENGRRHNEIICEA